MTERQVRTRASNESLIGDKDGEVAPPSYEDLERMAAAKEQAAGVKVKSRRI